ncbi:MAG: hypothetical protein IKG70_02585 [Lachnospiraceae bacterium]|nr:hypothetical protein [Lachnospiraceae bacterium]
MIAIGIDTGGTCTDAVVYNMESKEILASGKTLTTKSNLETGIANALDLLPQDLLEKADIFSLSTTLATNTCVENKGSRAKLLIIGTTDDMIERIRVYLHEYGITDISQLIVLDAKVENLFSNPYDPDWDELERRIPELFSDCDAIGVVQTFPTFNGGRFELTALRVLKAHLTIPVTLAFDICKETDFLKICASTLLNARLIPVISDFMKAVHNVMQARGLDIPLSIVRSDGTLMSEEMARTCPVETLLCGPAASVMGGYELTREQNAIIVDMGGTTTDLALIRSGEPLRVQQGIHIGQYQTSIKGLDARAISLGGDTAVRFHDYVLYLDGVRIIPISILASQYENVLPDLKRFTARKELPCHGVYEFIVLQKDISNKKGYTEYEQKVCEILKEKPLLLQTFAEEAGCDIYHLGIERLEQEDIIIRSGLTATDIMVLRGDLTLYDEAAARTMVEYAAYMTALEPAEVIERVYEMVVRRMYENIVFFLLQHQYPKNRLFSSIEDAGPILDAYYEQARRLFLDEESAEYAASRRSAKNPSARLTEGLVNIRITTDMPLIAIGAPTYVFLPEVAKLLGTRAIIPPYAHVANALGAAASNRATFVDFRIHADYVGSTLDGYSMIENHQKVVYENKEDAVAAGKRIAEKAVRERAEFQGLGTDPVIELTTEEKRIGDPVVGILTDIYIHAAARAKL